MGKQHCQDLLNFLQPYGQDITEKVMCLRDFAWNLCPDANELIYDNYNALAVGWSLTDKLGSTVCSIAVGRTSNNIHFGFYRGNELTDPANILLGNGNQYRYVLVHDLVDFPKSAIKQMVGQAYANALARIKNKAELKNGLTIVKSVSEKKRTRKGKVPAVSKHSKTAKN